MRPIPTRRRPSTPSEPRKRPQTSRKAVLVETGDTSQDESRSISRRHGLPRTHFGAVAVAVAVAVSVACTTLTPANEFASASPARDRAPHYGCPRPNDRSKARSGRPRSTRSAARCRSRATSIGLEIRPLSGGTSPAGWWQRSSSPDDSSRTSWPLEAACIRERFKKSCSWCESRKSGSGCCEAASR